MFKVLLQNVPLIAIFLLLLVENRNVLTFDMSMSREIWTHCA